jgi:excisionase family DNA binding protein
MPTETEFRIVRDILRDLQHRGSDEQAAALEAVLNAAAAIPSKRNAAAPPEYLTTGQAARALGVSLQTIKNWVASGDLPGARLGRRIVVPRAAIDRQLDALRGSEGPATVRERAPQDAAAARREYHEMMERLPAPTLARYEELLRRRDAGERLTGDERNELEALGRELTESATREFAATIRRLSAGHA